MLRLLSIILCLIVVLLGDLLATGMMGPVSDEGAIIRTWLSQAVSKYAVLSADVQRAPLSEGYAIQSPRASEEFSEGFEQIGGGLVAIICAGYFFGQRQRSLTED